MARPEPAVVSYGASGDMEDLIRRVVAGDGAAWQELWTAIQPTIWALTGKWQICSRLSERDDERHNIELRIIERLRDEDFRRLRIYLESVDREQSGSFKTWLRVVAKNTAIDYMRGHAEFKRTTERDNEGRWVELEGMTGHNPLPSGNPSTDRMAEATRMLTLAREILSEEQRSAVFVWLTSSDYRYVAEQLSLKTPKDAERLVRAALERIRRRIRKKEART